MVNKQRTFFDKITHLYTDVLSRSLSFDCFDGVRVSQTLITATFLKMKFVLADPLKQSQNPLGSRSEISHTINWVRSHLEQDDKVSIPKQEVYEDYV